MNGVQLEDIAVPAGITDRKLGCDTAFWPPDNNPRTWGGTVNGIRPPHDVLDAHFPEPNAVGEPTRVGNFADAVDVEGGAGVSSRVREGVD